MPSRSAKINLREMSCKDYDFCPCPREKRIFLSKLKSCISWKRKDVNSLNISQMTGLLLKIQSGHRSILIISILFRKSLKSKIASSAKDELKRVKANQSVLQKLYLSFSINLETLHYFSRRNLLKFFYTLQVEKLISLTTEVPNVSNCIIDGQHQLKC